MSEIYVSNDVEINGPIPGQLSRDCCFATCLQNGDGDELVAPYSLRPGVPSL